MTAHRPASEERPREADRHQEGSLSVPSRHHYRLFGLNFDSERPIPGLAENRGEPGTDQAVSIDFGYVPPHLHRVDARDDLYEADSRSYLIEQPHVVRLLIEDGSSIVAQPLPGGDEVLLWNSILGAGASVAGFQRGHIPLHASAILTAGGAVAFGGRSGFGKSTLVGALVGRGFDLLADDLVLLRQEGEQFVVGEGVPEVRLLDDAAMQLGWPQDKAFALQSNAPKYVFRRPAAGTPREAPLRRFYCIEFASPGVAPGIRRLEGTNAMRHVIERFRVRMRLHELPPELRRNAFAQMAAIIARIEIFHFVRPKAYDQFDFWLDELGAHIKAEER